MSHKRRGLNEGKHPGIGENKTYVTTSVKFGDSLRECMHIHVCACMYMFELEQEGRHQGKNTEATQGELIAHNITTRKKAQVKCTEMLVGHPGGATGVEDSIWEGHREWVMLGVGTQG